MTVYEPGIAVLLAALISILAVRALGETDFNPASGIGKISQARIISLRNSRILCLDCFFIHCSRKGRGELSRRSHCRSGSHSGRRYDARFQNSLSAWYPFPPQDLKYVFVHRYPTETSVLRPAHWFLCVRFRFRCGLQTLQNCMDVPERRTSGSVSQCMDRHGKTLQRRIASCCHSDICHSLCCRRYVKRFS